MTAQEPNLDTVTQERDSHVLVIGLNRPEKRNAFNLAMLTDLSRAYGLLESDDSLRAGGAIIRLPQQSGWGNAMRWLLTGDAFDAEEALRIGLLQVVGEDADEAQSTAPRHRSHHRGPRRRGSAVVHRTPSSAVPGPVERVTLGAVSSGRAGHGPLQEQRA
jgi:enoyl-CoA hydratase/carnithine racemase